MSENVQSCSPVGRIRWNFTFFLFVTNCIWNFGISCLNDFLFMKQEEENAEYIALHTENAWGMTLPNSFGVIFSQFASVSVGIGRWPIYMTLMGIRHWAFDVLRRSFNRSRRVSLKIYFSFDLPIDPMAYRLPVDFINWMNNFHLVPLLFDQQSYDGDAFPKRIQLNHKNELLMVCCPFFWSGGDYISINRHTRTSSLVSSVWLIGPKPKMVVWVRLVAGGMCTLRNFLSAQVGHGVTSILNTYDIIWSNRWDKRSTDSSTTISILTPDMYLHTTYYVAAWHGGTMQESEWRMRVSETVSRLWVYCVCHKPHVSNEIHFGQNDIGFITPHTLFSPPM